MAAEVIHGKLYGPVKEDGTRDEIHLVTGMEDIRVDGDMNLEDRLDQIEQMIEDSHLEDFATELERLDQEKAPNNHAAPDTKYGSATTENYGHVKLTETYNQVVESGDAEHGISVSQNAVANMYTELNNALKNKANTAHATTDTSNGLGDLSHYGHVKLSDEYTTATPGANATGGVGASQNALGNAYAALKHMIDTIDVGLTAEDLQKIKALLDANPISISVADSKPDITGIWANTGTPIGDETSPTIDVHPVE